MCVCVFGKCEHVCVCLSMSEWMYECVWGTGERGE